MIKIVICSMVMMILMGTVYSYSVFRETIEFTYAVSVSRSGIPYMTSLFFYALLMMFTGRFMHKVSVLVIALIGVMLIAFGWLLAAVSSQYIVFILGYGVLLGSGVGVLYGIPLAVIQKIKPERSGFYIGFVLLGFGLSPFITAPLARILIELYGLRTTFLSFSLGSLIILIPLVFVFKNIQLESRTPNDKPVLDRRFWMLYVLFMLGTMMGLMIISMSYTVGVFVYHYNAQTVTMLMMVFALLNGLARPLFGMIFDKKGATFALILVQSLVIIASIFASLNQGTSVVVYTVTYGLFWLSLGAWLAIAPQMVKMLYGKALYPLMYGRLFTAYGLGAIGGVLLSARFDFSTQTTSILYISMAFITAFGLVLSLRLKKTMIMISR